jgi:hypothetical protein
VRSYERLVYLAALLVSKNLAHAGEVAQEAVLKVRRSLPSCAKGSKRFSVCAHCKAVLDGTHNVVSLVGDGRLFPVPKGFSSRLTKN